MNIYEHMVKFKYKCFVFRCWVPGKQDEFFDFDKNIKLYLYFIKKCLKSLTVADWLTMKFFYQINYTNIGKKLADKFNMNACEIIHKRSGCGGVYYREWP